MTRLLILAASLGLLASQAMACDFMRSAAKVDDTKVASIATEQAAKTPNMSVPVTQPAPATVLPKDEKVSEPVPTE
jgi:hypothetical protein